MGEGATWELVRRLAQQIRVDVDLAGRGAGVHWRELELRLAEIEAELVDGRECAALLLAAELATLAASLRCLRLQTARYPVVP
jgi:hypothetical protein